MQIEKNVPIPARGEATQTLRSMTPGDSVQVVGDDAGAKCNRLNAAAQSLGFKLSRRAIDGGFRVWRVS